MKRLNVYDAVNRNRLLGTHPRWENPDPQRRYDTYEMARCIPHGYPYYVSTIESFTIDRVELQRVTLTSKDGWEAEVALVTYDPLEHLMRLRDFRLPGEEEYQAMRRITGY